MTESLPDSEHARCLVQSLLRDYLERHDPDEEAVVCSNDPETDIFYLHDRASGRTYQVLVVELV